MPTMQECYDKTNMDLVEMCRAKGIKGYSGKTKEWLVKNCCINGSLSPTISPKNKPRSSGIPDLSQAIMQSERERRAREERARAEAKAEEESRMERSRAARETFDRDVDSIRPANEKKIKHVSDYKSKDEKYQKKLIETIDEEIWDIPNPMYTGLDPLPCPSSMQMLRRWMEEGYVNDDREERDRDSVIRFDTISPPSPSSWRGGYDHVAEIKTRTSELGTYEFTMIPEDHVGRDVMEKRLKRFRGMLGKKCFELDSSDSKKLYGIFLKK